MGGVIDRNDNVRAGVMDESELVVHLRNGDAASYAHLVTAYGGKMLAVARRMLRNESDAQDCLQDAFLRAFKSISKFEQRSSLRSWLHRIVVNVALTKLRSRERVQEDSLDELMPQFDEHGFRAEPHAKSFASVESMLERRETREFVRESIDKLPEIYRIVLIVRDIEEYDTAEAAALLDLTPGAVKTRLHRARAALKALLEPVMVKTEP